MKKDTISKEIIKSIVQDISKHILKIEIESLEFIETEQQRVESRRADIVAKVNDDFVLHLEIQNQNDMQMPYRMLRYWLDIKRATTLPVKQFVIYIGKDKLSMKNNIWEDGVNFIYNILDMKSINCEDFIKQDTPDGLVLAILCDFKDKSPRDVVNYIITRLIELTKSDINEYRKYMLMLEELSTNRDLLEVVKQEEEMLSDFSMEKLPSYEIGIKRGMEKGTKNGVQQGLELGKILALYEIGLSSEEIAKKYEKSKEYVNSVIEKYTKKV